MIRKQGDVDAALAGAAKVFSAEYYQPHMAHIAMEPPVALVNVANGKVEVWAPVQSPYGTRQDVADKLGVPIENVTVHVTLLGGGFGRKSKCDYVLEAALLSKEVGAPVRVQWTREDDIQHSFYHTTSVERIEAAIDANGKVTGWRHRSVAPSIISTFKPDDGHQFPSSTAWASPTCRSRSPTSSARTARRWRTPGSGGSARCRTFRGRSRCSPSRRSWRTSSVATRRSSCSS